MQSYPNPMARAYIVKFIPFTSPNAYHVIDVATKITHSMWDDLIKAKQLASDLNLAVRRERTMAVAQAKKRAKLKLVVSQ